MDKLITGIQLTVLGMGIVFLILITLCIILILFKKFFYDEKKYSSNKDIKANEGRSRSDKIEDYTHIAIISAALSAYDQSNIHKKISSVYEVKPYTSYRKISYWKLGGRIHSMRRFNKQEKGSKLWKWA